MRVVFGVLGAVDTAGPTFAELRDATLASWPSATLATAARDGVAIGSAGTTVAKWTSADGRVDVLAEGVLRLIDGRETAPGLTQADDLAAIAALFERRGADAWRELDGSFFIVVRLDRTFHLGVDVSGARSVYWWESNGRLAFHTHLLGLAPAYPTDIVDDLGGIGGYLASGAYPPGRTAVRGIGHLGAAQHATLTPDGVSTGTSFRLAFPGDSAPRPMAGLVDELTGLLATAVATSWRHARQPLVPLSGGVDSRYLAAEIVRQHGADAVRTITWGEEPSRSNSDAVVAARVAERLGVANTWYEKRQRHDPGTFREAILLTSGENDGAIHYPEDHVLHGRLAEEGFRSLYRGDECFGYEQLRTQRAVLVTAGIRRLAPEGRYRRLLEPALVAAMAREQHELLDAALRGLTSRTPTGRRDELWFEFSVRRFLAPYNTLKLWDLEVETPFLDRRVLAWMSQIPDELRGEKRLFKAALASRFPELADIAYASRSNLPAWERLSLSDPALATFYLEWCATPGWLDEIGAKPTVLAALEMLRNAAHHGVSGDPAARRSAWRQVARRTLPGRLLVEALVGQRSSRNIMPAYLPLARLAVLHGLLGTIRERHGRRRSTDGPRAAVPDRP